MKTKSKAVDNTPANVNTHTLIQQVTRNRRISPCTKLVLIYLLEKYQTTREDGRPWDFSNASIQAGAGLKQRIVYNITSELIKANVLKPYGQITRITRPTILYLFVPEALDGYLKPAVTMSLTLEKDIAMSETNTLTNNNNLGTTLDDPPKQGDIAGDIALGAIRYCNRCLPQEDKTQEDIQKKKEDKASINSGQDHLEEMKTILDNDFYKKSAYDSIVPGSACVSNNPSGSVSVGYAPMPPGPGDSSKKVPGSMPNSSSNKCPGFVSGSVVKGSRVRYNPPMTLDPAKRRAYDESIKHYKVIEFKRSKYATNQESHDKEAIAKGNKMFPGSTIELYD